MGILDQPSVSRAELSNTLATQRSMLSNPTAFFGDSLPSYGEGFPNHVACLSNQQIQISGPAKQNMIFSYPGQQTSYLLTKVADVLALNPRPRTVIINGGTNDVIGSIDTATIMANLKLVYAAFEAVGIKVVLSTIPPLGGAFQYNGKQQPARMLNVAIRELAWSTGRPLVDPASTLVDKSSQRYQVAYDVGDNVHPSNDGIKAWANRIISDLSPLYPPAPTVTERTNSGGSVGLYPDPPFTTSGGNNGGSGSAGLAAALGCTTARANVVPTLVADASGLFNWQRFTVSDTTFGNLYYSTNTMTLTPGHVMRVASRIRTGQSGGALNALFSNYHGANVVDLNIPLYGTGATTQAITDSVQNVYFTVPSGATNGQLQINIPNVVGTYDIALPTIYDLTAMGAV